ncbi:MAG: 2-C-methyl-D-erythritol 4-phosphate cytidylyltransferase [Fimbriimonadales bacterium]
MTTLHALILAAGSGVRYGKPDKVWEPLQGAPLWWHAFWRHYCHPDIQSVSVAVAPGQGDRFRTYMAQRAVSAPVLEVGGATRQETVANALAHLDPKAELIAIHDGARPLVSRELLNRLIQTARLHGSAVPALPVAETLKHAEPDGRVVATVSREGLYRVQTPQIFRADWLREAHERARGQADLSATDDASVVEQAGYPVYLVPGDPDNLKLTTPEDMAMLQRLAGELGEVRTGIGYDIHTLTEGRKLMLGGIEVQHTHGLKGHSDADVILHALCDAMLGASALGDIGHLFPNTDPRWKDCSSLVLLAQVGEQVRQHGWEIGHLDAMVLAEAPKLAPYLPQMRHQIAKTLQILPEQVSLKATTNEGMDSIGERRAIACHAVATLKRNLRRNPYE